MSAARPRPGNRSRPRFVVGAVVVVLVAPRVFRAPEGPAAREARRPHFVRRRASKPARALRSLRRPPHQWGWVADVWLCVSSRSPARPRPARGHRGRSLRRPPHQWGWVAVNSPARPCHRPPAPRPGPAATHGHCSQTLLALSTPVGPGVLVGGGPPASRPRRELCSVRRLEASPGPEAISAISHVIPLRLVQTLNLHRWNCNVFVWSRKVTVGNYVRLLVSAGPPAAFCAAAGPASRSPPMPSGTLLWCARCGEEALFWIGTALLDSLLTYPERNNLSRLLFPIQFGGVCQPGGLLAAWQWGVLRHAKPSGGASPACRRLGWRNSPVW